jgi:hypothetical protein
MLLLPWHGLATNPYCTNHKLVLHGGQEGADDSGWCCAFALKRTAMSLRCTQRTVCTGEASLSMGRY